MKRLWTAVLACLTFACLALGIACGGEEKKLAFNEGYLQEIILGDPIMLDEYIDPLLTDDYTAILTCDETGQERDLKMLGQWTTDLPGTYTLTYKVKSGAYKGEIKTTLTVVVPEVEWQYSRPTLVYRAGDTMPFNALKRNLNLLVKSYYSYQFFIKSVQYGETKTDVSDLTEYTFPEAGEYIFTFAIKTEDGQELSANQKITVRPEQVLAEGAEQWMEENNITSHDYTYIAPNGKVNLDAGYYNNSITKDNVPYIAFNGAEGTDGYGAGTYVMVDFTGKNLPQVAFFCDEVTSSYTDGENGILFTNGITNNDGVDYYRDALNMSRLTIFGPQKVSFPEFDNRGRMLATGSVAEPNPMSFHALSESDQYRYIIGISDADTNYVTARILLINMTTYERVYDLTQKLTNSNGIGELNLTDYLKGSIVLYGRYGLETKLDKVYMPITDIKNIYELDEAASFKSGFATAYDLGATAKVSDYIDIPATEYSFTVIDPDGQEVAIDKDGNFSYTKSGKYRLVYDPMQENIRKSSITIRVLYDLENAFSDDFLQDEGAICVAGSGMGLKENTKADFINEGKKSVQYYAISNTDANGLRVGVSKTFTNFLFLSKKALGITFDVYTETALKFKLFDNGKTLKQDYTGEIPAETWTTLTLPRALFTQNAEIYNSNFSLALCLYGDAALPAQSHVFIDNIQLLKPILTDGAKTFMQTNGITGYGYTSINDDMQVSLADGRFQTVWYDLKGDDVPYIAYNGNYGAGSYVVADFTGKNVPQLCFFAKEVTPSLVDGKAGFYVHTGMLKKDGNPVSVHDGGRVTFFGPNKMEYRRPDATGRVGPQHGYMNDNPVNSPLSINGLEDGVHYRYVSGIKSASAGSLTVELLLINLDTGAEVVRYETKIDGGWITTDYISGNIVMYGRYNYAITLDKVYAAYTNVASAYDIDVVASVLNK